MRRTFVAAVVAAALAVVAGCGSGGSEVNTGLDGLRIGFFTNGGQTPTYVALTEGMFREHGLDVERVEFQDPSAMTAALQRGDIDLMSSIPGPPLAARAAGLDVQAIIQNEAAKYEPPDSGTVIAAPTSGISTLGDLPGKRVAIFGGVRSQMNAGALWFMQGQGIDTSGIEFVEAPFASHLDLLRSGQVDAVMTIDPFSTSIEQSGSGTVVAYPNLLANPGAPLSAWWATRAWVEGNPDRVEKFQQSLRAAIDWLYQDEGRARQTVAAFTKLDPALLANMPLNNWSYNVDEKAWAHNVEILVSQRALPAVVSSDEYWAPSMRTFVAASAVGR
ncbi:ABC transporter substrate-binding protein [Pseudonocardia halophobica]|uniref:Sulfonate ABC transporter substrate-binding protein n=1 Tax=Pseudonocardia halophobica TaxID=29401 RepID=A0A9W6NZ44_9PSEU|nr:ABC transporter substrate-binding protein [Pseudonocardia halophobica]GLL14458.1 sulfonate ABC transporter substrate-binding protein [Pseudonocardia halophobica]